MIFFQPVELREDERSSLTMTQMRRIDNGLNDISSTGKCIFVEMIKRKHLSIVRDFLCIEWSLLFLSVI